MNSTNMRRLVAILFADMVGYTALMQQDEQQALAYLDIFKAKLATIVAGHSGEIIQFYGDGCLSIFNSSLNAVSCAIDLQKQFHQKSKIPVRIGLHSGDVLFKNGNIFGDAVNITSRIESMGIPGAILFSGTVRNRVKNQPALQWDSLGRFEFKRESGKN